LLAWAGKRAALNRSNRRNRCHAEPEQDAAACLALAKPCMMHNFHADFHPACMMPEPDANNQMP
jgi:hypothetical protein